MKIGIISDTHDRLPKIEKAVDIFSENECSIIYHAGDFSSPFTVKAFKRSKIPLRGVFGNNDGDKEMIHKQFSFIDAIIEDAVLFDSIDNKTVAVVHYPKLAQKLCGKYDIVIFGHSHEKKFEKHGESVCINPGEGCGWLTGEASAFIYDTKSNDGVFYTL
ncbi:MAG: metallophosphoesterase [Candidatus Aureabacteria bacterium]|nr:metallophosphoesterase [Candidatus Auribacterota bacterium]